MGWEVLRYINFGTCWRATRADQKPAIDSDIANEQEKRGSPWWTSSSLIWSKLIEHLAWNRVDNPVDQMLG
jgi:hypothetical protein